MEFFGELNPSASLILEVALASNQTQEFFNVIELEDGDHTSLNHDVGIRDHILSVRANPLMFKTLTNFTMDEFHDLCLDVCPTIISCTRTNVS